MDQGCTLASCDIRVTERLASPFSSMSVGSSRVSVTAGRIETARLTLLGCDHHLRGRLSSAGLAIPLPHTRRTPGRFDAPSANRIESKPRIAGTQQTIALRLQCRARTVLI